MSSSPRTGRKRKLVAEDAEDSSSSDESVGSGESSQDEENDSTSGSDDEGSAEESDAEEEDDDDSNEEEEEEHETEPEQQFDLDGFVNVGEERELQPFGINGFQTRRIERETYFAQNLQDKMSHIQSEERDVDLAGVIIKLELYNFMCHSHLSLNFNKHINFIIGRNGSGKSAIMAAVMVALGTKASDTYRGRNLAAFIKVGTNQAKVRVTLNNKGINSYMYHKYGDTIILTRIIQKHSAKTYLQVQKKEHRNGEVVTIKKDEQITKQELLAILGRLKIYLPNCFALMAQDTMKTFWQMMEGEQMYDLLKEGTGIREAIQIHQSLKDQLDIICDEKNALGVELESVHEKVKEFKEKQGIVFKMADAEKTMSSLQSEIVWSRVIVEENALSAKMNQMQKHLNEKREKEKKLQKIMEQLEQLRMNLNTMEKEMTVLNAELKQLQADRNKLLKDQEGVKKKSEQKCSEIKMVERVLQVTKAEHEAIKNQLKKISKGSQQTEIARIEQQKQLYEKQEIALEEIIRKKEAIDAKMNEVRKSYKMAKVERQNSASSLNHMKTTQAQKEQMHKTARRKASSQTNVYGAGITSLQKALEKAFKRNELSKMPIGPIGAHIQVKDPKWDLAVEVILKNEFRCFYVNSDEDRQVVADLNSKLMGNYAVSIVTCPFVSEVYDVSSGKAESIPKIGLYNLMDMLIVDKPEVMNYLIDQRSVESILLCEDLNKAFDLMANVKTVPKNCTMMVTTEAEQIYPAPLYRYYSAEANAKVQYLVRNAGSDLKREAEEMQKFAEQIATEEKDLEKYSKEVQNFEKELKALRTELVNLDSKELLVKQQMETNRLEALDISQSDFNTLNAEFKRTMIDLEEKEQEREKFLSELQIIKEEEKGISRKLSILLPHLKDVENKMKLAQGRKADADRTIANESMRESCLVKAIETMSSKEAELQRMVEAQESRVREAECTAGKLCPRVITSRTPNEVNKEIQEIQSYLDSVSARISDPRKIITQLEHFRTKERCLVNQIKAIDRAHEELSNAMLQRRTHYNNKIIMIFMQMSDLFKLFFESQSFEGQIKFDHQARTMCMELTWKHSPDKTLTNPSGGERTFSIISLILSVWDRMKFPFYILDEFDVYMDMVNRHRCTDMLVQMARSRRRYQYIFLTPQDSNLTGADDLTIHKLADPRPENESTEENSEPSVA